MSDPIAAFNRTLYDHKKTGFYGLSVGSNPSRVGGNVRNRFFYLTRFDVADTITDHGKLVIFGRNKFFRWLPGKMLFLTFFKHKTQAFFWGIAWLLLGLV